MAISVSTPFALALPPQQQRQLLQAALGPEGGFGATLAQRQLAEPRRSALRVLQLNLGRLCNMQCSHCHVDAGPDQGASQMAERVVQQCLEAIGRLRPQVVDPVSYTHLTLPTNSLV